MPVLTLSLHAVVSKVVNLPRITCCFSGLLQLNKIKLELHNHVRRWYVLFSLVK